VNRKQLIVGVISLALATVIVIFTDGARRLYAGAFFALLGVVTLVSAKRSGAGGNKA
jgi:hypothetical protein